MFDDTLLAERSGKLLRPGAQGRRDLRGCKGCKEAMLAKMKAAAIQVPDKGRAQKQRHLLFLTMPDQRTGPTKEAIAALTASGWAVREIPATSREPAWGIPKHVEAGEQPPDVVLRWEECGELFTNKEWRDACAWCHERGIKPMQIDFGYFDHYHTIVLDTYAPDGKTSIKEAWPRLSERPQWERADERLRRYRAYMANEWKIAERLGPVPGTEPGYVLVYIQYSCFLSNLPAGSYAEWIQKADKAIRESPEMDGLDIARNRVVWKKSRVQNVPIPDGSAAFGEADGIPHLNTRLLRYARHSVVITSTVTNEAVLRGLPVVACGRGWHSGLGVFAEAKNWGDLAKTPQVNEEARAKWTSWWLERSCALGAVSEKLQSLLPPNYDAAGYMTGIGMGNLIMAVPGMKAFSEQTGVPLGIAPIRRMASGYPELLRREPWCDTAQHTGMRLTDYDVVTSAAFLKEIHHLEAMKDKLKVVMPGPSAQWPHEVYRNAGGARRLGFEGPLPSCHLRIPMPTRTDLPTHYVVVGMDCTDGKTWSKRRWPHWQRFAELWAKRTPLVFVGVRQVPWAAQHGMDLIGQLSPIEMAAIIQQADAYVGIDNGPSHVAASVRTPTVGLYGPTSSIFNGPWQASVTALAAELPCRPCIFRPEWSSCKHCNCMRQIPPEKVVGVLENVLFRQGRPVRSETWKEQLRARVNVSQKRGGVPAAQRWRELAEVWGVLEEMRPEVVVEIGVKRGGWLWAVAPACAERTEFIGIDVARNPCWKTVERQLVQEGHKIQWVVGDSHMPETADQLNAILDGRLVDVLHIDGDHSKVGVLKDWEMYSPLVRSGGVVLLHDAANPTEEVSAAFAELQRRRPKEVETFRLVVDPHGTPPLGIAIAKMK